MTALTFVRHGETEWNRERRIQGSTDIPLNDTGRAQARAAAEQLRASLPPTGPVVITSSALTRAQETAQIIADALDLPAPVIYPGLRERNYGEAEGVLVDDFPERFGKWERHTIPGAEPASDLRVRAVTAIRQIARDVRDAYAPTAASVIAVSHGGVIRELIRHASSDTLPLPGERIANGSLHTFIVERDVLSLRDYSAVEV